MSHDTSVSLTLIDFIYIIIKSITCIMQEILLYRKGKQHILLNLSSAPDVNELLVIKIQIFI